MKALEFSIKEWDTDGDGVLDGKMHVTYDIEFHGPNTMTNTILSGCYQGCCRNGRTSLANRILQINIVLCMKRLLY